MKHLIFLFICIVCISNSGDAQIISTVAGGGTDAAGDGGASTKKGDEIVCESIVTVHKAKRLI